MEVRDGDGDLGTVCGGSRARQEAVGPIVDVNKVRSLGRDVGPDERDGKGSRGWSRNGGRCADDDCVGRGVLGESSHGEDGRAKAVVEADPLGSTFPVVEGVGGVSQVVVRSVWSGSVDGEGEGSVGPAHPCHTERGCGENCVVLSVCLVVWGWVWSDRDPLCLSQKGS